MSIGGRDVYASVWQAENKGSYLEVRFSTSRKDYKAENPDQVNAEGRKFSYVDSSWSFVRFVGKAASQGLENNVSKDGKPCRIKIPADSFMWSHEPYMKDGQKLWAKNPKLVVFNFEYLDGSGSASSDASTPSPDDQIPF